MTVTTPDMQVVLGVDTHQRTHHAAVLAADTGRAVADRRFETSAEGYAQLLDWAGGFGRIEAAGIESSASYGAGLTRAARAAGVAVIEVNAPDEGVRHRDGKTDEIDAYNAARAVLSGRAEAMAKDTTGIVESIRMLHLTRKSAVDARATITNQLRDLCTTAPAAVADRLRGLTAVKRMALIETLPGADTAQMADPNTAFVYTAQSLVHRHRELDREINALTRELDTLMRAAAPTLLDARQIGPVTGAQLLITAGQNIDRMRSEASFAKLTGVAPLPASSGKTSRHRINKGGDRQANSALHLIAVGRLKSCKDTRAYRDRRLKEDKFTRKDVVRCLKRYIARQVFHALQTDLRKLDKL